MRHGGFGDDSDLWLILIPVAVLVLVVVFGD